MPASEQAKVEEGEKESQADFPLNTELDLRSLRS